MIQDEWRQTKRYQVGGLEKIEAAIIALEDQIAAGASPRLNSAALHCALLKQYRYQLIDAIFDNQQIMKSIDRKARRRDVIAGKRWRRRH